MTIAAKVRTGVYRIPVAVTELDYGQELVSGRFSDNDEYTDVLTGVWISDEDATNFLYEYAETRKLKLLFDGGGEPFGLYNPRHNSFRRTTITEKGLNLLEFIEPNFVLV